jgi:hypothetical protein
MSSTKFVVSHMDQQLGPFEEHELKSKWVQGEILPIDYVYDESKQDWILLAERFAWAASKNADTSLDSPPPPTVRTESVIVRKAPVEGKTKAEKSAKAEPVSAPAATTASTATAKKAAPKVKLIDGQGEIDLSPLDPGRVELGLQDTTPTKLRLQEPLRIQVKPAEPVEVVWTMSNQQVVGQELEITLKALDEHGNVCLHYTDDFVIQVRGPSSQDLRLTTKDGQASLKLSHTKAEMWSLSLQYQGSKSLRLPETRMLEWQPGPASHLVIDGPHEYIAGLPLKVQVKAVDDFGNVAKNYQGTVVLEVKAS